MQLPKRKPGKFTNLTPDPKITQEKYHDLERELAKLKKKQPGAASEVSRLAELGDFSENVEYQLAKRRLREINNAIVKIEQQLMRAEIIGPPKNNNIVAIGHTVTIFRDGNQKTYKILGEVETNPVKGVISNKSPLGDALLGRKLGEKFKLVLPSGSFDCEVVNIE